MSEEHRDPAENGSRADPADGTPTAAGGRVDETGAGAAPRAEADLPAEPGAGSAEPRSHAEPGSDGGAGRSGDAEPPAGTEPPAAAEAPGADDSAEEALRRLLREAVQDIEPDPESLEHLRRAVPARRRRKVHALVGAVAVCVLFGISLPLMLGKGMVPGLSDRSTATTASTSQPAPDEGDSTPDVASPSTYGPQPDGESPSSTTSGPDNDSSPSGGNESEPEDSNETLAGVSPSCVSEQLGDDGSAADSPDEQGRVYGTFRVSNVSADSCTVSDPGLMAARARNESRAPSAVQVLEHTGGMSAMGLPAPEEGHDTLILKPGEAYEVRFAWVPEAGGGVTGCDRNTSGQSVGGTDDSEPRGDTSGGTDSGGTSGGEEEDAGGSTGETGGGDAAPTPKVVLEYAPGTGGPHSQLTLENACAGTVYRTGMLPTD